MSDIFVRVKSITKRELSRNPAKLSSLKPGETIAIADLRGGLTLTRSKRVSLTADQIEAEIQRICAGSPPLDSRTLQEDED